MLANEDKALKENSPFKRGLLIVGSENRVFGLARHHRCKELSGSARGLTLQPTRYLQ